MNSGIRRVDHINMDVGFVVGDDWYPHKRNIRSAGDDEQEGHRRGRNRKAWSTSNVGSQTDSATNLEREQQQSALPENDISQPERPAARTNERTSSRSRAQAVEIPSNPSGEREGSEMRNEMRTHSKPCRLFHRECEAAPGMPAKRVRARHRCRCDANGTDC